MSRPEFFLKGRVYCLVWNAECAEAFETLKRHLCTSPVLKCPDLERPFVLLTDASNWGVGAVLSQVDDADNEHPVAYFSKKLLPRERRYTTIEKECLAIKLATNAFRVYLLGKPIHSTDHHALEWLDRLKEDNARQAPLHPWSCSCILFDAHLHYQAAMTVAANTMSIVRYKEEKSTKLEKRKQLNGQPDRKARPTGVKASSFSSTCL